MSPALNEIPGDVWVPDTTLSMLDRAVAARAQAAALVAGGTTIDYRNYGLAVDALARRLLAAGAAGGTVAIILSNSIAIALALFAAQRAGAVSAALNPDYSLRELAPMFEDSAPKVVIVHDGVIDRIRSVVPANAATIIVGSDEAFVGELLREAKVGGMPALNPDSIAVLQFTGGTTGRAKGVELSHRAVATNVAQREAILPTMFGDERIVCVMPMFHSFAAAMCVHLAAYCAGTLHIFPRYRPDWLIEAIERHAITRLPAGPTIFNGLLGFAGLTRDAVVSLRSCFSGSAPLARDTLQRWEMRTGVPIYEGYGQSEAGPILTYQGPDTDRKVGSVGYSLPGTVIKIVDPADGAKPMRTGESGEILARGPQIMRGYRGQPEATSETLRDGWLATGDIGHLDEDGHLFIDDRKKDMAIVGGYNVYPREVDEVLMAHPSVQAAACVGVADAYRGEVIAAFVVVAAGKDLDSDTLLAHCADNLVRYKHPTIIRFVGALPLTPVGKIDKAALRATAIHGQRGVHVA